MSDAETLDIVAAYVGKHQPQGFQLKMSRVGAQREGDRWYIVVEPSPEDIRARDYRDVMEQIEEDLEANEHLKVLLLPTLPGD